MGMEKTPEWLWDLFLNSFFDYSIILDIKRMSKSDVTVTINDFKIST